MCECDVSLVLTYDARFVTIFAKRSKNVAKTIYLILFTPDYNPGLTVGEPISGVRVMIIELFNFFWTVGTN